MQAIEIAHAPVAQLDRVTDYESVGQGFESLPAYQNEHLRVFVLFYFLGLEYSNTTVRGTVAHARLDGHDTSVFAHSRAKTQPSPFRHTRTNTFGCSFFLFSGTCVGDGVLDVPAVIFCVISMFSANSKHFPAGRPGGRPLHIGETETAHLSVCCFFISLQ